MELNMHKKWLTISKTISDCKKWKIWKILCLQAVNLAPKWTAGVRHGTSLVVRRVWSGRIIVVLFWTKYAFPRQIKPGIFKLTTCRGHNNFILTVFSFVNCEEKGCYRVVSISESLLLYGKLFHCVTLQPDSVRLKRLNFYCRRASQVCRLPATLHSIKDSRKDY